MSGAAGELVAVNVAKARLIMINGEPVKTGIFKRPVSGRVSVGTEGLEGDRVADLTVHGGVEKAVYAYAAEDYDWWSGELAEDLGPGTFGENLTTRGLELAAAKVGERWRVGEALLEVSEPRQPCSKLGAKMGDQRFVKRFAKAARFGCYLRVVEPGTVGTGDSVEVVSRPDHDVTMALMGRVVFEDRSLLPEVLAAGGALGPGWREWAEQAGG